MTGFIIILLIMLGAAYYVAKKSKKSRSAGSYRPPVDWVHNHYSKIAKAQGNNQPQIINLVNLSLIQERRSMPSCIVWYNPKELDERVGPDHWVSVMDGNTENDPPGHVPPHYIQTIETKGSKEWFYKCRLQLWSVAPEVIHQLNQGPRRSQKTPAVAYGSGETANLLLPMGVPGQSFAPPPLQPDGGKGSSDWKDAGDLAGLGAVQPPASR